MRLRKRWLVPTMVGAALAWRQYRRGDLARLLENLHRWSAAMPALYDDHAPRVERQADQERA